MTDTDCAPGRIFVPRWVQLALLPALALIAWFTLGALEQVVFIFLVAAFIAMVLNPLVRLLERARVPRFLGVFLVYAAFVAAVIAIVVLVWPPFVEQMNNLVNAVPGNVDEARSGIQRLQEISDRYGLGIKVDQEIRDLAAAISDRIPAASRDVLGVGAEVVRQITIAIIVIVVSVYMLLDARRIGRFVAGHFPTHSRADGEEYVHRAQGAVVDYIKAQVLLSVVMGASVGVAMWLLSVAGIFPNGGKYALFFGVWAGVMEALPYLGPVLAAVPPTIVALFESPTAALWVIVVFVLIQEVEGHILVPVIMGGRFRVHPLIVIFAVLAGGEIHGITGMLLAIPLIPLAKETIVFLRPRLSFERWCVAVRGVGDVAHAAAPPPEAGPAASAAGPAGPAPPDA
jgi:predicted PurR-regulated permease PerM